MTAKEYLSQAFILNQQIADKLKMIERLNELATLATATLSGMPHSPNRSTRSVVETVDRIIDLQTEINGEVDKMVCRVGDIVAAIRAVDNMEFQSVLEKRYLCYMSWDEIARAMCFSLRWTYRVHGCALEAVDSVLRKRRIS